MGTEMNRTPEQLSDSTRVAREIEIAFAEARYPGDNELVESGNYRDPERDEIANYLRAKKWADLDLQSMRNRSEDMHLLSPVAFRYYLPAYMRISVLQYEEADLLPHSVVFSLIKPADPELAEYYLKRMSGFTSVQRSAINAFLWYLKKHHSRDDPLHDIDSALASLEGISQK